MASTELKRAQKTISELQDQLINFRKQTYKSVHDDIGSGLSAVSIKAKLLADKLTDSYEKKEMGEIHSLIRETLEHVTQLNRKLKISWVPTGTETLFSDIEKELLSLESKYNIQLSLEVVDGKSLKKLPFATMTLIYEWISLYVQHASNRIAESLTIQVDIHSDRLEWKFIDEAPLPPDQNSLESLITKTSLAQGSFVLKSQGQEHIGLLTLTLPKGET